MAFNAHCVFTGSTDNNFLAAITVAEEYKATLREARDICRAAIRGGLVNWSEVMSKSLLFEAVLASAPPSVLRPKFKMQGSFSYFTLNAPAQSPPQEVDLDDGVFLPVSFLNENGAAHPGVLSSGYFNAVEAILSTVCKQHGWDLDTSRPSCVRVRLGDNAHIDFALYAIPDSEFGTLVEAEVLAKAGIAQSRSELRDQVELAESIYRGIREDHIMLAHRHEGWKPSDPRKLEDWFREAVRKHGGQLRRSCRFIKAWRDHHWPMCRLSSIALMACVVSTYDGSAGAFSEDRDDLALLAIGERLAQQLAGRIENPVVVGQFLDEGWSAGDRAAFVAKAKDLHGEIVNAIRVTIDVQDALDSLSRAFGERVPADHDLLEAEGSPPSAPVVLTTGLMRQMGAEAGPRQAVNRDGDRRYG